MNLASSHSATRGEPFFLKEKTREFTRDAVLPPTYHTQLYLDTVQINPIICGIGYSEELGQDTGTGFVDEKFSEAIIFFNFDTYVVP